MLSFLPSPLKGSVSALLFVGNTLFWTPLFYPFAVLKILIPNRGFRRWATDVMVRFSERWISGNDLNIALTQKIHWDVQGLENLSYHRSYLVCANHQAWGDIVVLQHVFNRQIPFLRFFLKQQLLYVPLLGGAWWALDFPFMKRYSKEYLQKHPEKKGRDLEATRRACARFANSKISVLNFMEGTRFTPAKHARQKSPYQHLLRPKAGGFAFVLDAMGSQFHSILDVTIVYPEGPASLWGMLSGQISQVVVRVNEIPIPTELLNGNYLDDEVYRERVQEWVRKLWENKNQLISKLLAEKTAPTPEPPDQSRRIRSSTIRM